MYVIPAAMSIYYSFTDYNLLSTPNWVGLKNYITIFTADEMFRKALAVTFLYVFIMVPLRLAFALFVATRCCRHRSTRISSTTRWEH